MNVMIFLTSLKYEVRVVTQLGHNFFRSFSFHHSSVIHPKTSVNWRHRRISHGISN
jgi:hypothetical protein